MCTQSHLPEITTIDILDYILPEFILYIHECACIYMCVCVCSHPQRYMYMLCHLFTYSRGQSFRLYSLMNTGTMPLGMSAFPVQQQCLTQSRNWINIHRASTSILTVFPGQLFYSQGLFCWLDSISWYGHTTFTCF